MHISVEDKCSGDGSWKCGEKVPVITARNRCGDGRLDFPLRAGCDYE